MNKIILDFQVTGCPNHCFHCHSCGGNADRMLMDLDLVRKIASKFRERLNFDIAVRLLEEQTYYKNFFSLVNSLESDGFMKKDSSKTLVTNCWGLTNETGFIDEMKEHFSCVKATLFGINETHDIHAGRKGSYKDIIEASKLCVEKGIDIVWELMWTKLNTTDMDKLYEIGDEIGVKNIFISGELFYTGSLIKNADKFFPLIDDVYQIKHDIYEYKNGYLKTQKNYYEDILSGKNYDKGLDKVNLNEIYIDKDLNVYPLCHLSSEFCLGNINDAFDKIVAALQNGLYLPEAIISKREMKFSDLVIKNADISSNQLYTCKSLFDKLSLNQLSLH